MSLVVQFFFWNTVYISLSLSLPFSSPSLSNLHANYYLPHIIHVIFQLPIDNNFFHKLHISV